MYSYSGRIPAPLGNFRTSGDALPVNGSQRVALGLLSFAALIATDAGRPGESGTGAMWIAPELVAAPASGLPCSQVASLSGREVVFEILEPGADADPRLLAAASREMVDFEWDPSTGELAFHTTSTSAVFNDLVSTVPASAGIRPSCGSR